jgi:hypothetical protein
LGSGSFDYEPLRVLAAIIRERKYPEIGGAPQVVKVYKALKTVPFVVPWVGRAGDRQLTLLGRPLLDYEAPDRYPELPDGALEYS